MQLGKVSVNTTKSGFTNKSVSHRLNFIVLPLHVSVFMGPSSGSVYIIRQGLLNSQYGSIFWCNASIL
jgi:hypothetical protein